MAITNIHSPRPRLKITQDIIDRATRKDSGHCIIAETIKAQIPNASGISVDLQSVRWTDRALGLRYIWFTPLAGQRLLLAYDFGLPIKPQTIRFDQAGQIVEVKKSSKDQAAKSAIRRQELKAKELAGEELTGTERRSLSQFRRHDAEMAGKSVEDRASSEGSPVVKSVSDKTEKIVKVGGRAPGAAVLGDGRGRRRQYGVRVAGVPADVPTESPTID